MALRDMVDERADVECETADASSCDVFFVSTRAKAPLFSALEEQVLELAAHDGLASLEAPGFLERIARIVFGLRKASRALADPRLEALRRALVVARHRRHLPDPIARELRRLGYGAAQLRAVEARAIA